MFKRWPCLWQSKHLLHKPAMNFLLHEVLASIKALLWDLRKNSVTLAFVFIQHACIYFRNEKTEYFHPHSLLLHEPFEVFCTWHAGSIKCETREESPLRCEGRQDVWLAARGMRTLASPCEVQSGDKFIPNSVQNVWERSFEENSTALQL